MVGYNCPLCNTRITVPDEQVGKKARCPHCGKIHPVSSPLFGKKYDVDSFVEEMLEQEGSQRKEAEVDPWYQPSTPNTDSQRQPSVKDTTQCPFCGEEILEVAVKCKHCKSDLSTLIKCTLRDTQGNAVETLIAKDMKDLEKMVKARNLDIEVMSQRFGDEEEATVYTQCHYCGKIMSIDDIICPKCGKQSGFLPWYHVLGGIAGGVVGWLVAEISFLNACFLIPGGIFGGVVIAIVVRQKKINEVKRRKWTN